MTGRDFPVGMGVGEASVPTGNPLNGNDSGRILYAATATSSPGHCPDVLSSEVASFMCPECNLRPVYCRGVCKACYMRAWRKQRSPYPSLADRVFARIQPAGADECWLWMGNTVNGYGNVHVSPTRRVRAHRWVYEYLRAEIPEGLVLDHLCRTPLCVNPWHLEPVTIAENSLRGQAPSIVTYRTGVCPRGHSMDDAYVVRSGKYMGRRNCRPCTDARRAARSAA